MSDTTGATGGGGTTTGGGGITGGTTGGDDRGNTELSEAQLRAIHLPPFREAIRRGVSAVMVSYSSWNGARLHGDKYLLTDVLKNELGFSGVLVSDYGGVDYLDGDKTTLSAYDVRTAVNAGIDLVMVPDEYSHFHAELVAEVHAGRVSRARIDDAVSRIKYHRRQAGRRAVFQDLADEMGIDAQTVFSAVSADGARMLLEALQAKRAGLVA